MQIYTVGRRCGSPKHSPYTTAGHLLGQKLSPGGSWWLTAPHLIAPAGKALLADSGEPAQPVRVTGPAAGGQKEVPGPCPRSRARQRTVPPRRRVRPAGLLVSRSRRRTLRSDG